MVTLTANVAVVPVEHLTAFGGPAACTSEPEHINTHTEEMIEAVLSGQFHDLFPRWRVIPTHAKEWFQKTHTGLVLSSVSSRVYSKVMGGSRMGGRGGPSLCTVALTMAVLITGRLGSLQRQKNPACPDMIHVWLLNTDLG